MPIFLVVVGVNYFGDAAKLFSTAYEEQIVDILEAGQLVTNLKNYDERILQEKIINRKTVAPDILILGSSRMMLLGQAYFDDQNSIYNSAVSSASLEDFIAIFQIYKSQNLLPKKVIIGFEPWLFNNNNELTRWKSIASYYYTFCKKSDKNNFLTSKIEKYNQLLSLSYFQSSIKELPNNITGKNNPIATLEKRNATNTKLLDGSISHSNAYRLASQTEINTKALNYIEEDAMTVFQDYESFSPTLVREFELLIEVMQEDMEVIFVLTPYHPLVYPKLNERFSSIAKSEKYIYEFAKKQGFKITGSFNPKSLKMDESFFFDGLHCNEKAMKQVLDNL